MALGFGGMVLISTDSLFTRWADVGGFDVSFWVGVFTAASMLGGRTLLVRGGLGEDLRRGGRPLLAAAALQAAMTTLFVLAVKNTSVANVVVIIAAAPLLAAVTGWVWSGERPSTEAWTGIAVSTVGVGFVVSGSVGGGNLSGDLMAVGAIACFALSVVVLRRHPAMRRTTVVGLGGVAMAVASFVPAGFTGYTGRTWPTLLVMGAVTGPLARVMLGSAPRYLPAGEVGLFAPVETVLGTLWAYLAFGEAPPVTTWIGGVIILAGVLWAVWPRAGARRRSHPPDGVSCPARSA